MTDASSNAFVILGIASREDSVSSLLARVLETDPTFAESFLRVVGASSSRLSDARVRVALKGGTPDLVISGVEPTQVIVIENKLKAREGAKQTERYSSDEFTRQLLDHLDLPAGTATHHVLLTLFPERPASGRFVNVAYSKLLADVTITDNGKAADLLRQWLELVEEFYRSGRVRDADGLISALTRASELDGGFLYFRKWLGGVEWGYELHPVSFFRSSARGRRFYGVTVKKSAWELGRMDVEASGKFPMRSDAVSVHFEFQFDLLSARANLYLHYEPNPYRPVRWMKRNVTEESYLEYQHVRDRFKRLLADAAPESWKVGGRSNQIAKLRVDLSQASTGEATNAIQQAVAEMGPIVDRVFRAAVVE